MDKRRRLLLKIMEAEFTAIDLNLYLDAQPQDQTALGMYNEVVGRLMYLKEKYDEKYGPLANFGYSLSEYPAGWVEEPWPWEINFA